MKGTWIIRFLSTASALPLWGCAMPEKTYPALDGVTRIEVQSPEHLRDVAHVIDSKPATSRFEAFVNQRREGWGGSADTWGVPAPYLVVNLYRRSQFLGHIGVGHGFLEAQIGADLASRSISAAEEREFLELVGERTPDRDSAPH